MAHLSNSPHTQTMMRLEARKSFSLGVLFVDDDDHPVDMTGCDLTFVMSRPLRKGGGIELDKDLSAPDIEHGLFRLDLQAADLDLLPLDYPYTITLFASGFSVVVAKGEATFAPNTEYEAVAHEFSSLSVNQGLIIRLLEQNQIRVTLENLGPLLPANDDTFVIDGGAP